VTRLVEIVNVASKETDLQFKAKFSSSEAVEEQVDAVVYVEQTETDGLE